MVSRLVRNYAECYAAFAEAAKLQEPLALSLPEGAVSYLGLLYIHTMLKEAQAAYSGVRCHFICACGDNAALVQEALGMGFSPVSYSGSAAIYQKLASIAAQYGAELCYDASAI